MSGASGKRYYPVQLPGIAAELSARDAEQADRPPQAPPPTLKDAPRLDEETRFAISLRTLKQWFEPSLDTDQPSGSAPGTPHKKAFAPNQHTFYRMLSYYLADVPIARVLGLSAHPAKEPVPCVESLARALCKTMFPLHAIAVLFSGAEEFGLPTDPDCYIPVHDVSDTFPRIPHDKPGSILGVINLMSVLTPRQRLAMTEVLEEDPVLAFVRVCEDESGAIRLRAEVDVSFVGDDPHPGKIRAQLGPLQWWPSIARELEIYESLRDD